MAKKATETPLQENKIETSSPGTTASKEVPEIKEEVIEAPQLEPMTVGASSVTFISTNPGKKQEHVNSAIKFKVAYSKDFKGVKYWKNGDVIEVSKESAMHFEQIGVGKIN